MTDAIRLTVEVGKRVYHTGHSKENKNTNRDSGETYSKTATTQWPPSSDSINRNSFTVDKTKSFTVNLSKTQLSPGAERWNWVEESQNPLTPKSTLVFDQIQTGASNTQKPKSVPEKTSVTTAKTPEQPKPAAAKAPEQSIKKESPNIEPEAKKGAAGEKTVPPGGGKSDPKPPKGNPEQIALEKMKARKTKQPRPCKCGKAKDVTLLLKDLCECDTLNLRRINLVKLFADYQKQNKAGNPLPYLTDSLIVYKNRMSRPQVKQQVEWTTIPRKGKKGVQFKKPESVHMVQVIRADSKKIEEELAKVEEETKKIEEEFQKLEKKDKKKTDEERKKDGEKEKKGDKEGKKKVEMTVKYAEESLVTLFKNTSKKDSIFNLTEEQLQRLNYD